MPPRRRQQRRPQFVRSTVSPDDRITMIELHSFGPAVTREEFVRDVRAIRHELRRLERDIVRHTPVQRVRLLACVCACLAKFYYRRESSVQTPLRYICRIGARIGRLVQRQQRRRESAGGQGRRRGNGGGGNQGRDGDGGGGAALGERRRGDGGTDRGEQGRREDGGGRAARGIQRQRRRLGEGGDRGNQRLAEYLHTHSHFVDSSVMYSLKELRELCDGTLLPELEQIHAVFRKHIEEECETCAGNGFFCELCDESSVEQKDKILYPFTENTRSCTTCLAVYHKKCFERKSLNCPRCDRRKKRSELPTTLSSSSEEVPAAEVKQLVPHGCGKMNGIEKEMEDNEKEKERLKNESGKNLREFGQNRLDMDNYGANTAALKQEYDAAYNALQNASREEKSLREKAAVVQQDIDTSKESLKRLIARSIYNGINGVKKVMEEFRRTNGNKQHDDVISGYYGTVIELIDVPLLFVTAVEVIVQNRLFYHVVETDRIATKILRKFNEMQLPGELNFFPLNRVSVPRIKELEATNLYRAMSEVIDNDVRIEKIIKSVTANVIIVKALDDVAPELRKEVEKIKQELQNLMKNELKKYEIVNKKALDQYMTASTQKVELTKRMGEQKKSEDSIGELLKVLETRKYEAIQMTFKQVKKNFEQVFKQLVPHGRGKMNMRIRDPKPGEENINAVELYEGISVLVSFVSDDGDSETREMTQLSGGQKSLVALAIVFSIPKCDPAPFYLFDEIDAALDAQHRKSFAGMIESLCDQAQFGNTTFRLELLVVTARQQLETVSTELDEYVESKNTLERKIENQMEQQRDYEQQQRDCQKAFDKIAVKEEAVKQKREDGLKKMRQLGALPTDTFSKWQNVKQRDLEKKLIECVNDLKKYENVNKKALDQYMTASTQKEELTKRMGEQKKSEDSIEELLKVLETRKYEAIQMTFKQVKKNFEQVFKQLVPHGRGKMNMRIPDSKPGEDNINAVVLYEGISVLVSFVSDDGDSETREMTQLSGGQKSLVALAIIFSIQKCDPAPFYLFDEIDAALDAQHRKSVADMIKSLSDQAQFVTTTFRPELLATAEKFFGVRFRNKVSHIDSVTREQAYDFVEDDTTHG